MKNRPMPPVITMPENVSVVVDALRERDRKYFEDHPERKSYIRPAHPFDAWPQLLPEGWRVKVDYIRDGVRLKTALPPAPKRKRKRR